MLRDAGIKDVVINLGYKGKYIADHLGDGSAHGLRIQYSQENPERLLGSGGGVKHAQTLLGNEPIMLISADIWSDMPLASLRKLAQPNHMVLRVIKNPSFNPQGDFSIDASHRIRLDQPTHNVTYSGIGVFCPSFIYAIEDEQFGLSKAIELGVASKRCTGQWVTGAYENVGTPEQLYALRESLYQKI